MKKIYYIAVIAALCLGGIDAMADVTVVDAAKHIDLALPDCGIQQAIDSLPPEGGVVLLPNGVFALDRFIRLRSNLTLRGEGAGTILKCGSLERRNDVVSNEKDNNAEIVVAGDITCLEPGMFVTVWRRPAPPLAERLWNIKTARVREVREQTIVLDGALPGGSPQLSPENKSQIGWGLATGLAEDAAKGDILIEVDNPAIFRPGYAIYLNAEGELWNAHHNIITAVDGNRLTLERPLPGAANKGVEIRRAFPMLYADGDDDNFSNAENITIENLHIEGVAGENELPPWSGFSFSAIHIVRYRNIVISNVEIRDWHADGFSLQRGERFRVENCAALGTFSYAGFHPGTKSDQGEFLNCRAINNHGNGIYFCWENTHVAVRNCLVASNGWHGISSFGDPREHDNVIEGCVIAGNGWAGIEANGGGAARSAIRDNIVRDNSMAKPGAWPGIAIFPGDYDLGQYIVAHEDVRELTVEGNTVESTIEPPTQWVGIQERNPKPRGAGERTPVADGNRIVNNKLAGHERADIILVGPNTVCEGNTGTVVNLPPRGGDEE